MAVTATATIVAADVLCCVSVAASVLWGQVAGVDRDLSVAERKMLVARDALAFIISVSDGQNRLRLQNALASIAHDFRRFQDDLVIDVSTILDAMRSDKSRENRQLMAEACNMLRGMMTGALLPDTHALASLSTAERRKIVTERGGLEAIMQCIADAMHGDDEQFLIDAFECLAELGGAEACRAQMVEKGGVCLVLALMSQHLSKSRMAELGCHLIMMLVWRRPETQEIVAALPYESGLAVVLAAMRNFPGDAGVQCCGCGALAAAVENESNCTLGDM